MTASKHTYLHDCYHAFPELARKKVGIVSDFRAIEDSVRHLRHQTRLAYQDVRRLASSQHWGFGQFWFFPPAQELTRDLDRATFDFPNLRRNERTILAKLLEVFKYIELVSVVLRFVYPEHYGILSPPVELVLDVRRGRDESETYLNYCKNLWQIKDHYGFPRAADVDMALWALYERCFGEYRDPVVKKVYDDDVFMRRLRARNLVTTLRQGLDYAQLAETFEAVDPEVASLIACYMLEIRIRNCARKFGVEGPSLGEVIKELQGRGVIDLAKRNLWMKLKDVRNKFFHEGRPPLTEERAELIKELAWLEVDLAARMGGNLRGQ